VASPADELSGEEASDRQIQLGEAVDRLPICISVELAEVRQPRVCPLDWPARSHRLVLLWSLRSPLALIGDNRIVNAALGYTFTSGIGVIPAIEPQSLDVAEQPTAVRVVESRDQHDRVVAVCAVDSDFDRNVIRIGEDRPLPSRLCPISRILAGSLASTRALAQRTVDRDVTEIEPDDLVVGALCFFFQGVEHAGCNPLVTAGPQGGVGDHASREPLCVLP